MFALTMTTIRIPMVLEAYVKNFKRSGRCEEVFIIVAGDKKTPAGIADYLAKLSKTSGIPIKYLSSSWQRGYLKAHKDLGAHLPWNSFARRNLADLHAYSEGADVIIRVDDDNAPLLGTDYLGDHLLVGKNVVIPSFGTPSGWFNCCELLAGPAIYPRGYPYPERWKESGKMLKTFDVVQVGLNAGLWLGNPDVDAITRLTHPIDVPGMKPCAPPHVALESGTWCPINTQNTAYHRDLIPAAFVSPYVGRYDDIWSGYMLRAIMDHLGDSVTYGAPLVKQDRNPHDLWNDLALEMKGNVLTPHLIEILKAAKLKGTTYATCYVELAGILRKEIKQDREYFAPLWEGMEIWAALFS